MAASGPVATLPSSMPSTTLSPAAARRVALAAQGFTDPRPLRPDRRALRRVTGRVALLQVDSVNVLTRAHYLPLYSRLGTYPPALLDRASSQPPRLLFEYWGHEASLLRVDLQPLLRWRMARALDDAWGGMRRIATERPELVTWVLEEVRDRGPVSAGEIEHGTPRPTGGWGWNWSEVKRALEFLFWSGQVTSARRRGFERLYDLSERVLPADVLAAPTPTPAEAHRELVRIAASAHGVASVGCLRDYFRLELDPTRTAVAELVEAGELVPVTVHGWSRPAYLHREARIPRRVAARALVGPFDSLVWDRARTEAIFGFRYRLEIYVPRERRVHGYYVLPFLLGDRLVARVDLKADRRAGVLRVQAAWEEPGAPGETAEELADELAVMAGWLGLSGVEVTGQGDLGAALAETVRRAA
jgi:hypothetical protein